MRKGILFVTALLIAIAAVLLSCGASKKMGEKSNVEDELLSFQRESFMANLAPVSEGIDAEFLKKKTRDFFEALISKDFEKASVIAGPSYSDARSWEKYYGDVVEIVSIGDPLRQKGSRYPGVFVPYEIKFASGELKKWQIAMKRKEEKWIFDGGL